MTDEEKRVIKELDKFSNSIDMTGITAEEGQILLNLIEKQQKEKEKLKKVLDDSFVYVTGGRTVYSRLMCIDKETLVKDDLTLRNEIKQYIKKLEKKDKQIDLMCEQLVGEYIWSNKKNGVVSFSNEEEVKQYFEKEAENEN